MEFLYHALHTFSRRAALAAPALGLAMAGALPARADTPPPAPGLVRSALFEFGTGDRLEDSGRMVVTGGRFGRTEHFEVVRRADGGWTLTSVTVGDGDSYRVEGRWKYAADHLAQAVTGRGAYQGQAVGIDISGGRPGASIVVTRGGRERVVTAPCEQGCLVDMAPSALPMFTMTRLYRGGGSQTFRWIGQSLIADEVLLDGTTEIRKLGEADFTAGGRAVRVRQFAFVETLKNATTGATFRIGFNLYVDPEDRPLAFAIGSSTIGERSGYEGLVKSMPAQIPEIR
jgi:hypothetical protein